MRKAAPSDQNIGFGSEAALKMATPPTAGTGTLLTASIALGRLRLKLFNYELFLVLSPG